MQADDLEVLDIRVKRGREAGFRVEMQLGDREFPAGAIDASLVEAVAAASPEQQGARLFAAFTADEAVRMAWNLAAALAPRRRLRLRIDDDAAELHALPWEALHDLSPTATAHRPAADRDTPFSRLVPCAWDLLPAVREPPLGVLTAVAAPTDLDAYSLPAIDRAAEQASLAAAMAAAPPGLVQHTALAGPCTLAALEAALEAGHHVLHLVAHGVARRDGEVSLLLERADGSVDRVDGASFAAMLERLDRKLRLIVLMVCNSAARSPVDAAAGLVPKLLAAGVPAVLAMQDLMPIDTGRAFTGAFYGLLWSSGEIDRAANRARATLQTGRLPGSAVPVLYSNLARNCLHIPPARATIPDDMPVVQQSRAPAPAARWSAWERLGGPAGQIAAVCAADGCVEVFALDLEAHNIYGLREQAPGGRFDGEDKALLIGDQVRQMHALLDQSGAISVFCIDLEGKIWQRRGVAPDDWAEWQALGGAGKWMTAACGARGTLIAFALGRDGLLVSSYQLAPPEWDDWYGDWEDDDETHLQLLAIRDGRGQILLFSLHSDFTLWSSQQGPEAEFADWQQVARDVHGFHAVARAGGRVQLVVLDEHGGLRHCEQKTPGGLWGGWQRLGGTHSEIVAITRGQDGLEIFGLTADGQLAGISRQGGSFGPWTPIPGPRLAQLVPVENGKGALELLALDREGTVHRCIAR